MAMSTRRRRRHEDDGDVSDDGEVSDDDCSGLSFEDRVCVELRDLQVSLLVCLHLFIVY